MLLPLQEFSAIAEFLAIAIARCTQVADRVAGQLGVKRRNTTGRTQPRQGTENQPKVFQTEFVIDVLSGFRKRGRQNSRFVFSVSSVFPVFLAAFSVSIIFSFLAVFFLFFGFRLFPSFPFSSVFFFRFLPFHFQKRKGETPVARPLLRNPDPHGTAMIGFELFQDSESLTEVLNRMSAERSIPILSSLG